MYERAINRQILARLREPRRGSPVTTQLVGTGGISIDQFLSQG